MDNPQFEYMGKEVKVTNESGLAVGLPAIPNLNIPDFSAGVPGTGAESSTGDPFDAKYNKIISSGGDRLSSVSLSELNYDKKYPYAFRGIDSEEMYAQQQSSFDKATNGVLKGSVLVGTTIAGGFGTLYGAGKALFTKDGKLSDIWDNEIMHTLDKINANAEEALPNYYTAAETNSEWWQADNLLTANFLFDKVIKNSGFAVGAMVSGNIANSFIGALGSAAGGLASTLSNTAKASNAFKSFAPVLRGAARSFSAGKNVEAAAIMQGEISSLADASARSSQMLNIANQANSIAGKSDFLRKTAISFYSSAGEANFEALQTSKEFRENLISEFIEENGVEPSKADLDKINEISNTVGATSFAGNMALLTLTEFHQLNYLAGSSYKATKKMSNSMLGEVDDVLLREGKYIAKGTPTTKLGKVASRVKSVAPYLFDPKEMGQELGQYALQVGTSNYFGKSYNNEATDAWTDAFLYGLIGLDEEGEGVGALNSKHGLEGGLIGGLTGAAMQGVGRYVSNKAKKTNTDNFIKSLNEAPTYQEAFKDKLASAKRGETLIAEHGKAIAAGERMVAEDIETDIMHNYIYSRVKYGRGDMLQEDMQELIQMGSTVEGLNSLKEQGLANTDDSVKSFKARIQKIESTVQEVSTLANYVNLTFGGEVSEDANGKPVKKYNQTVLDKMVYAASKIADYDVRIPLVSQNAISRQIDVQAISDAALNKDSKPLEDAYALLEKEQSVDKKSVQEELMDVVQMSLSRKQFVEEFNDMVNNPDVHQVVAPTKEQEEKTFTGEKISIKTKKGPRDIEVGTEYYLGRTVKKTKKGNEVYGYPKLKVLGKNEDGTIKIETSTGVRDVSEEEFADYNLGKVSTLEKDDKGNFYYKMMNKVFEFNFGEKSGGKKKGRLEYSPVEGQLLFTYKNKKGESISIPIFNYHFSANNKYKKAQLIPVGDLTAEQTEAKDKLDKSDTFLETPRNMESRKEVFKKMYQDISDRITNVSTLIETKSEQLLKYEQELSELEKTIEENAKKQGVKKSASFTKLTKEAIRKTNSLNKLRANIINNIDKNEALVEELEFNKEYVSALLEEVDNTPTSTTEYLGELKEQLEAYKEGEKAIRTEINSLKKILTKVEKALQAAYKMVTGLITTFESQNPNIPYLKGESFQSYLRNNPEFVFIPYDENDPSSITRGEQELQELEDGIAFIQDATINPSLNDIQNMKEQIADLNKELVEAKKNTKAHKSVVAAFEEIYKEYVQTVQKTKQFQANEKIMNEFIGLTDNGNVIVSVSNKNYEADPKKDGVDVVGSTIAFSPRVDKETGAIIPVRAHHTRSNSFGINYTKMKNKAKLKGIVVSNKTEDQLGLKGLINMVSGNTADTAVEELIDEDEVLMFVIVQQNKNGTYTLVDENGKAIPKGSNLLEKGIFQTFPKATLAAKYSDGYGTMFRKGEKNETQLREKYEAWKKEKLSETKLSMPEAFKVSFGITKKVTTLLEKPTADGEGTVSIEQIDYDARIPVTETELVTEADMAKSPVLLVSKSNDAVHKGSTTFKNTLGKGFLNLANGLVPLNNRKFTKKEASVIYDTLLQLAKNAERDGTLKTDESRRLFTWLKSVSYWGMAKDAQGKRKSPGYSSIWFEKVVEDDKAVTKLFFSGKGASIVMSEPELLRNKESVLTFIENLYFNVNAKLLEGDTYNAEYSELIGYDKEGNPQFKTWENYQMYLLLPNGRPIEEVPLATNVMPIAGTNKVNRQGIYFTRLDSVEDFAIEEEVVIEDEHTEDDPIEDEEGDFRKTLNGVEPNRYVVNDNISALYTLDAKVVDKFLLENPGMDMSEGKSLMALAKFVIQEGAINVTPEEGVLEQYKELTNSASEAAAETRLAIKIIQSLLPKFLGKEATNKKGPVAEEIVGDGTTQNVFVTDSKIEIGFRFDLKKALTILKNMGDQALSEASRAKLFDIMMKSKTLQVDMFEDVMDNLVEASGREPREEFSFQMFALLDYLTPTLLANQINIDPNAGATSPKIKVEVEEIIDEEIEKEEGEKEPTEAELRVEALRLRAEAFKLAAAKKANESNPTIDDDAYRIKVLSESKIFEKENWDEVEEFFKNNFPNLPLFRVKNVIKATNGRQAWGMLHNAAIYIQESAEIGTAYHEVFEAVWKMFATVEEKANIVSEFKDRDGSFVDRFTGETILFKEATDAQIKEEIAEEFRDQMLYGTQPNRDNAPSSILGKLFKDIIEFFKTFFLSKDAQNNTSKLFTKITTGQFKHYNPYETQLSYAKKGVIDIKEATGDENSEYRIKTIPADTQHEVMQHMTFVIMRDITKNDKSLFDAAKLNKTATYREAFADISNILTNTAGILEEQLFEDLSKLDVLEEQINNIYHLLTSIEAEWPNLVRKHTELMSGMGIKFEESQEINPEEAEKGKNDLYSSALQVDNLRSASAVVKLLLGSIPVTNKLGKLDRSNIGGAKLIPMDEMFIKLKNKLFDSTSLEDMVVRMAVMARTDKSVEILYNRIFKTTPTEEVNFSSMNKSGGAVLSGLWKAMKGQQAGVVNIHVLSNGEVIISNTALGTAAAQEKRGFFNNIVASIRENKDNYFLYDKKSGEYSASAKLKGYVLNPAKLDTYTKFLDKFGITFTEGELVRSLNNDQLVDFRATVDYFKKSLEEIDGVKTLNKQSLNLEGRVLGVATFRAIIDNPAFKSTYFNINGERSQTYIGTNLLNDLYTALQSVDNVSDLASTQFRYLLTDSFSKGSLVLKKLFDLKRDGDKVENSTKILSPQIIDGTINDKTGKKSQSSKLSFRERVIQELNLNLDGVFMNLVPGDASLEWAVRMYDKVPFVSNNSFQDKKYLEQFKDYFISEAQLIVEREVRKVAKGKVSTDLRFFKDILTDFGGENLHTKISQAIVDGTSAEKVYKENKKDIDNAVTAFIEARSLENRKLLSDFKLVEENDEGLMSIPSINFVQDESISEKELMLQLNVLEANYIIANIELHKLLFSDPYQYKDELKRIKNFLAPRQAIIANSLEYNKFLDKMYNEGFGEKDYGYYDFYKNHFNSASITDVKVEYPFAIAGESATYDQGDGGGFITEQASRALRIRSENWTEANEEQFIFDMEFRELVKSGATKAQIDAKLKLDPEVPSTYTPEKPIIAGSKLNDRGYNDVLLDKLALFPLSFKILYKINPNSNAIKLLDKMHNDKVDYVVFSSGRKVGNEVDIPLYDENFEFNTAPFQTPEQAANPELQQTIIKVPHEIISIQSEVPSKDTNTSTQGSQATKLVTIDVMEAGVPIDFLKDEDLSFQERFDEWEKLEDKTSYNNGTNLYNAVKHNQEILEAKIEQGYVELLDKLGITESVKGFEVSDRAKLIKTLRGEIAKREINDNLSDVFDGFEEGNIVLEATPAYSQIRNILYSIADKNVIHPKISGGMKVQVPETLLETSNVNIGIINGKKALVSGDLKFYEDEDGKRVCEIMVARWFESSKTDEELLDDWYVKKDGMRTAELTEEGKKALSGVGFRIPTQKLNSIDAFVIKSLLPVGFRDSVVVPSGIVAKVGSDFDIDKLTVYLKNLMKDNKGVLVSVPYFGIGESALAKFRELHKKLNSKKINKLTGKIMSQANIRSIVVSIADGTASEEIKDRWLPLFEEWFPNSIEDNMFNVDLVLDSIYNSQLLKTKKLNELTDKDLYELNSEIEIKRWYKKSLENEYIDSMMTLITHPVNFQSLVKPNSAEQIKRLSAVIKEKTKQVNVNYNSAGTLIRRKSMTYLRQAFVSGKRAIGIAATGQTNHSNNQKLNITLETDFENTTVSLEDRAWLGEGKITFKNHNSVIVEGKERASLSMVYNKAGEYISDLMGMFIDGYVDISNGPWIMELGATPNVTGTWQFLIKIGVPIDEIAYFMNQPVIREYLAALENKGSSWLFNTTVYSEVLDNYFVSGDPYFDAIPDLASLQETISKNSDEMSDSEKEAQVYMLGEFLKYAKFAEHLFKVTQATNQDTATFNDSLLVFKKNEQLKEARNTAISSVDALLESNFVYKIKRRLDDIRDAFSEILISDKNKSVDGRDSTRTILENVLREFTYMSDRDFIRFARKAVNDLFDYAVQTNTGLNTRVASMLLGNEKEQSVADQIVNFRDQVLKNPEHRLYNNVIINNIKKEERDGENKAINLYIDNLDNKIYDQNLIIAGFAEIEAFLKEEKSDLYGKLVRMAIIQSGLSNSPIAFTNLLPYESFVNVYNEALFVLSEIPHLAEFYSMGVFQRNNWNDSSIVPFVREETKMGYDMFGNPQIRKLNTPDVRLVEAETAKEIPKTIRMSESSIAGKHDFITFSWDKPIIITEEDVKNGIRSVSVKRALMRKKGDNTISEKVLMRKVYVEKDGIMVPFVQEIGKGEKKYRNYIYKAVNAWGDSFRAQEFYKSVVVEDATDKSVGRHSVLNNDYMKVNEVSDSKILELLNNPRIDRKSAKIVDTTVEEEIIDEVTEEVIDELPGFNYNFLNNSEEFINKSLNFIKSLKENPMIAVGQNGGFYAIFNEAILNVYDNNNLEFVREDPEFMAKFDTIEKKKMLYAGLMSLAQKELRPTPVAEKVITLSLQPENISKVLDGSKTTTVRSLNEAKNLGLDIGQTGVTTIGGKKFNLTNRGYLTIEEAGGVEKMSASENFKEGVPKFEQTKTWLAGKTKLMVYDISELSSNNVSLPNVTETKPDGLPGIPRTNNKC